MSKDASTVFFWILVLAAAALAAWIGAWIVARVVKRRLNTDEQREPFTLQDLRELRAQSAITEAEFQTMRAAILGHYTTPPDEPARGEEAGRGEADDDEWWQRSG